ncbi:hypothetical protein EJ08DRAFT_168075 [Tothia fuscella]|uniref:Uncharacterized protein n=1 Tax=Tothia fuscella TaxID=1048955 RepID=A0A9P4NUC9_9PEZI|nr:hypothetical protein EJ08DRAFT_168075 [Tothia fuscella]
MRAHERFTFPSSLVSEILPQPCISIPLQHNPVSYKTSNGSYAKLRLESLASIHWSLLRVSQDASPCAIHVLKHSYGQTLRSSTHLFPSTMYLYIFQNIQWTSFRTPSVVTRFDPWCSFCKFPRATTHPHSQVFLSRNAGRSMHQFSFSA